jgi:hypothetical protein
MIVGSLLLILVAVTLLILGLAGGSSVLLISSIATSLLAAVSLVVGARQAAAVRATAGGPAPTPLAVDLDDDPGRAAGSSFGDATSGDPAFENAALNEPTFSDAAFNEPTFSDAAFNDATFDETAAFHGTGDLGGTPGEGDPAAPDPASSATTQANLDASAPLPFGPDDTDPGIGRDRSDPDGPDRRGPDPDQSEWDRVVPDVAASVPGRFGWTAERSAQATATEPTGTGWAEVDRDTGRYGAGSHLAAAGPAGTAAPFAVHPDPAQAGRDDVLAQLGREDAEEDPADEPAPQRVQPTDAVQVSRMTVDVLVVDGRPRYHLPGCRHLADRETEPLPVAEAVDLGFTPCSLCRPVDRLVAGAARR